ncbi:MAG: DNA-directed RNA polymerase subunit beta, partial [Candidatus Moraniibacteriota bacterium]
MSKTVKALRVKESISKESSLSKRRFFNNRITVSLPDLIEVQKDSYQWFWDKGLKELFSEINPIADFTSKDLELTITDYYLDEPKYPALISKNKNISYEAPLRAKATLLMKKTGEVKEQEIYLGDFPVMTERGTFIINGVERVVVSQLIRSPGVFFTMDYQKGKKLFGAKIIPNRGAWLEIETDLDGVISVKIDRKRKLPITALFKAFGFDEKRLRAEFADIDNGENKFIENTILKDPSHNQGEAYREVYKRLRPGDLATEENAKQMIDAMFFNFERYDFGAVGRYRLNQRLSIERADTEENRILNTDDLILIVQEVIRLNNDVDGHADDIDHLGNRRVRAVGELIQNKLRVGMYRMVRNIKDRMSTCDPDTVVPGQLINPRPVAASVKEFFSSSQLSQFMDQVNPLAELEHKRRLSAMGPGGLTRERAGFEVRDVHHSHYGRICPIETPEGPNIGLVGHLASYARVNEYGFLETPYLIVKKEVAAKKEELENRILGEAVAGLKVGEKLTEETAKKVADAKKGETVKVRPFVTLDIEYLNAIVEDRKIIAHARINLDDDRNIIEQMVGARVKGHPETIEAEALDYIDVSV